MADKKMHDLYIKPLIEMKEYETRLRNAWIEYDRVDYQPNQPRRVLETVAKKHNVDPMEVLSWYSKQPNDERRDNR
ncbi:hypothetical protein [Staphylococcus aureus]|nr:hypothetical protein [Staphylococcus aureus]